VIDLHCHILPGVDDGPESMEATLEMARAHVAAGVERVAATPHVSWDIPTSAERMASGVAEVNATLKREGIPLAVVTGGELAMTRVADLTEEEVLRFRLGGGAWLLVESPLSATTTGFEDVVRHLQARGHRILLAHPERCPGFQRDPERLEALVSGGALTSITAGAFAGRFGGVVERFAHRLAQDGLIHNIASDAHDLRRRPPGLRPLLEHAGYGAHASWWCAEVPAAILAGAEIPPGPPPPEPRRRGVLARLRGASRSR
jgi:protein-tyrosine phosphatase